MLFVQQTPGLSQSALLAITFLWISFVDASGEDGESKETYPAPVVVAPSQDWDGNDGPWSTFPIQIGTPPQSVKVVVATSATQTWAIVPEGCQPGDPANCAFIRGNIFDNNASSTWVKNIANLSSDIYELGLENDLGYSGKGRYGFDDVTLGWKGSGGPTLKNQTVAGVATKSFMTGVFGLTPRSSNFTSYNNPIPSYMENLRNRSLIPSLSWGYTAGNQYRLNSVLGSLTLGGYDASRFTPTNISFPFSLEDARDLSVRIESITSGSTPLLPTPISAFLDSTIPYLYLPLPACKAFESAFGLIFNETSQLYLINSTQHDILATLDPSIEFRLGDIDTAQTVNITFPYSAFALTASYPLMPEPTRYFPLKRAANGTQYTLGRAFFQEAYVIADYERRNFSVSQCTWDTSSAQNIIAILPPSNTTTLPSAKASPKLPIGLIAGIAGGVLALILALISLYLCHFRPKRQRRKAAELEALITENHDNAHSRNPTQSDLFLKPELENTLIQSRPIHEVEASKLSRINELGGVETIYEMPAREEVAIEMTGLSTPGELEGSDQGEQRWSKRSWRDRREFSRGLNRDSFGFPTTPENGTISSWDNVSTEQRSPRSMTSSPIISPRTPGPLNFRKI